MKKSTTIQLAVACALVGVPLTACSQQILGEHPGQGQDTVSIAEQQDYSGANLGDTVSLPASNHSKSSKTAQPDSQPSSANARLFGQDSTTPSAEDTDKDTGAFPFSPTSIGEKYVNYYGKQGITCPTDKSFSHDPVNKRNCFILMSKKDYYLYVYEVVGEDTVLRARFDCAFALRKGNKTKQGDMKTPDCTMYTPFSISQICPASSWRHNFGDGRGNILAYGAWFLRLNIGTSNRSIGIHGSTNNRESVPGRASEGCIRLKDEDIKTLKEKYAHEKMRVIIKAENIDDLPFEIKAMHKQHIERKRHFDYNNDKQVLK